MQGIGTGTTWLGGAWGPQRLRLAARVAEPSAVPPGAALSLEVISLISWYLSED